MLFEVEYLLKQGNGKDCRCIMRMVSGLYHRFPRNPALRQPLWGETGDYRNDVPNLVIRNGWTGSFAWTQVKGLSIVFEKKRKG